MTIQRQYSLPNCTLLLEGLGDLALLSQPEARPLMSVLINAECHLPGQEKPLSGGREFLESLVTAVSHYAQEVISSIHATHGSRHTPSLVQLQRLDTNHHRLSVLPEGAVPGSGIATHLTRNIDLTTVQFFDLVEAVDQFFADSQTLPDLTLDIKPLPRRYARSSGAGIAQQSAPAALGVSGLALAAIALFAIPVPKITQPTCLKAEEAGCTASPKPSGSPTASPSPVGSSPAPSPQSATSPSPLASAQPDPAALEAVLTSAPEITSSEELDQLNTILYNKINDAWKTRTPITKDLIYRVGVNKEGEILGYKPVNQVAADATRQTPLLDLLKLPPNGSQPGSATPLAQFKVVFTPNGGLEVAPWKQVMQSPVNAPVEITDDAKIKQLQPKLYDQINNNWNTKPTFDKDLLFRVRVKQDGSIYDYRPENQPAKDYVEETSLSKLGRQAEAGDNSTPEESLALYKVVFKPNGVLEINPWRGRQD